MSDIQTIGWIGCITILSLVVGTGVPRRAHAQAPVLPALTQPVNDFANVIDPAAEQEMDRLIRTLQAATGDAVIVATVDTVSPYGEIREYAVELFENRGKGIGGKENDNGLLILLAIKERQVWIEVGYGLEQWITDGFAGETSRSAMAPLFRVGNYGAGLLEGVRQIVGRIAQGRNVTLTGVDVRRERRQPSGGLPVPVILLILIALMMMSGRLGGPGRGAQGWGRRRGWSGWSSGVGPFGGGWSGRGGGFGGGGFGGGFGGFGGGRSGGGGGGASW